MSKRRSTHPQQSDHKRSHPSVLKIATGVLLGLPIFKAPGILLIAAFVLLIILHGG